MAICEEPPQHDDSAVLPYALHTIVAAVNIPGFIEIKLDFEAIVAIVQGYVANIQEFSLTPQHVATVKETYVQRCTGLTQKSFCVPGM